MAICFFIARHTDGSGDIVQTVKIADFVHGLAKSHDYSDDIIIVVPDLGSRVMDDKAITQHFINEINPKIRVQTVSEFKNSNPTMDCCIEAGYLAQYNFDWKKEVRELIQKSTPLIFMPEYGNDVFNSSEPLKIKGGFFESDDGVIPSQALLDATHENDISPEVQQHAFECLTPKIQKYLGENYKNFINEYRTLHGFTYQYSHDKIEYPTFYGEKGETDGADYRSVNFFLQEHIMHVGASAKSQDVLCLGGKEGVKKKALKRLKETLIDNGYTKITFVNVDNGLEEVLHSEHSTLPGKEYRALYSQSVPFSTMNALPLLSDEFVGVTGDNSLVEAMSARKLVSYECMPHKRHFVLGYLSAVEKETQNKDVILLANLLMKEARRCNIVHYDVEQIKKLLKNTDVVNELKNINRNLIIKSQYFKKVEDMLVSHVFKKNLDKQNNTVDTLTHLDPLSESVAPIITPVLPPIDLKAIQQNFEGWLKELDFFNQEIKKKTKQSRYTALIHTSEALYTALDSAGKQLFTQNPNTLSRDEMLQKSNNFFTACFDAISNVRGEFKNHRGPWFTLPNIVRHILGVIIALPVLLGTALGLTLKYGYKATFWEKPLTQSEVKLNQLHEKIKILQNNIIKEASLEPEETQELGTEGPKHSPE